MVRKLDPMFFGRTRGAAAPERPLRDELLSIERLDERARSLAARFTVDPSRRAARSVFPRFDDNVRVLREAYRTLADDVHRGEFVTAAAEWLLDNYHLVASEIRDVRQNLPRGYYRELPKLAVARAGRRRPRLRPGRGADPPQRQPPRPAAAGALPGRLPDRRPAHHRRALGLAEHAEAGADREPAPAGGRDPGRPRGPPRRRRLRGAHRRRREGRCRRRCRASSTRRWSCSSCSACASTGRAWRRSGAASTRTSPRRQATAEEADPGRAPARGGRPGLGRQRHHQPAPLRHARLDPVRRGGQPGRAGAAARPGRRLRAHGLPHPRPLPAGGRGAGRPDRRGPGARGPAGGGERAPGGRGRGDRARAPRTSATTSSARGAASSRPTWPGAPACEGACAASSSPTPPPPTSARSRSAPRRCSGAGAAYARHARGRGLDARPAWRCSCSCRPARWPSRCVQRLAARLAPPRRLPRLDFSAGVPEDARTLVVVPTLLTSVRGRRAASSSTSRCWRSATSTRTSTSRSSATSPTRAARDMPEDAAILAAARAGIEALNARLGEGRGDRFFLFHRARQWNAGERAWMGWERKRGKLEELNRLLRGATDTSFDVQVGELGVLPRRALLHHARLRHAPAARRRQEADRRHRPPAQPAALRPAPAAASPRATASCSRASASPSPAPPARASRASTPATPASTPTPPPSRTPTRTSSARASSPARGSTTSTPSRRRSTGACPTTRCSPTTSSRGSTPAPALVTDVEVVDDYPSSVLAHARRQHRWTRGDWQILRLALPLRARRAPACARNRLPLISRWKILDNLRRTLVAPATVVLLLLGLDGAAGQPGRSGRPPSWPRWPSRSSPLAARGPRPARGRSSRWRAFLRGPGGGRRRHRGAPRCCSSPSSPTRPTAWPTPSWSRWSGSPSPGAGCWSGRRPRPAPPAASGWSGAAGARSFLAGHGREPGHRAGRRRCWSPPGAPGRAPRRRPPCWRSGPLAPLIAYRLSPAHGGAATLELGAEDRQFLLGRGPRPPGRYFEAFMGPEDHGLPADNFQETPDRGSPTGPRPPTSAWGCSPRWRPTTSASSRPRELVERIDATLTTMEGLERLEGHLLQLVRHGEPGAAPAPLRLHRRQRQPRRRAHGAGRGAAAARAGAAGRRGRPAGAGRRLEELARRAAAFADGMSFRFLYDPQRSLLAIGYRPADAEGPGRLDPSYYDLLASEARLASFIAIAKGDLPEKHWFHLGRAVTSVHGSPALLSWSATLFEYLMPLLLMRSYPDTLLDESCRMAVRRQRDYAAERGVPWGISESAYDLVDRHGNYQYKAFGVPGLGLKRGLADELVVAPYATALAALVDPTAAAANLRRLAARGAARRLRLLRGHRLHAAPRRRARRGRAPAGPAPGRHRARLLRPPPGDDPRRPRRRAPRRPDGGALPRRPARAGHGAAAAGARAAPRADHPAAPRRGDARRRRRCRRRRCGASARRTPPSRTPSSCRTATTPRWSPTPAAAPASAAGAPSPAGARTPTRDPGGQFLYLRDVRSGRVWSADPPPDRRGGRGRPGHLPVGEGDLPAARRRHRDAARRRGLARGRRRGAPARGDQPQRSRPRDRGHELRRDRPGAAAPTTSPTRPSASSSSRRSTCPRAARCSAGGGRAPRTTPRSSPCTSSARRAGRRGRSSGRPTAARFLGRGRGPEDPQALDGRAALRHHRRPARPHREPAAAGAPRARAAWCGSPSPPGWPPAGRRPWRWPSATTIPAATARTFALAFAHAQSRLRHLGISSEEALLFERLASRVLYADASLRAGPELLARNTLGQEGLWAHGISGDLPILLVRVVADDDLPLVRQVLQAQEYWRLKGLSADVVILNEHPVSYLDEMHAQLAALLDDGPWRAWKHRPGGAYLLRGDRMAEAERAPARRRGARGPERRPRDRWPHQLDRPDAPAPGAGPARRWRRRAGRPAPAPAPAPARGAAARPRQRPRRLRRRRARVRHRPRGRRGDAAALGQRHRQPGLRHGRHGLGRRPSPGRGTAARTGSRRSPTTRSAIRPPRRSSSATTRAARPGRRRRGRCRGTPPAAGS